MSTLGRHKAIGQLVSYHYNDGEPCRIEYYVAHADTNTCNPLDKPLTYCMVGKCGYYENMGRTNRSNKKIYNSYIDMYYYTLPGPPHWEGAEGGCLGLPKDVAKMILKWL